MELVVVWIVSGIIAGVAASNKGRSGGAWFLIGLLLGPLGILLALVVSKDQKALENQAVRQGDSRKCPFCAEVVKSEAVICKHCRMELPPVPEANVIDAVRRQDFVLAKRLLEAGADVNQCDEHGRSALELAYGSGNQDLMELLVKFGGKRAEGTSGTSESMPRGYY